MDRRRSDSVNQQALLSRAAESIFWMGRYVERAENVARTVEVNLNLLLDSTVKGGDQWSPIYEVMGDEEEFKAHYDTPSQNNVMRFLTFDTDYGNSIASCLYAARENARSVREIISSEMWEHLNRSYLAIRNASPDKVFQHPSEFYRDVRTRSHLFEGLTYSTMSQSEAWHFAMLGRMIERADQTSRILDVKYFVLLPNVQYVGTPVDDIQWGAVLKSVSGFEMYRKEFGTLVPANIVEFLLMNQDFPRAISHCLRRCCESLYNITRTPMDSYRLESERLLSKLRSDVMFAESHKIVIEGLHEYLDEFQLRLNEVGDSIRHDFFATPESDQPAFQAQS